MGKKRRSDAKREKDKAYRRAKRAEAQTAFLDLDYLRTHVEVDGECWLWRGPFLSTGISVRPIVWRNGHSGCPKKAIWQLTRGKPRGYRRHLKASCGQRFCVSPEHLYETNHVVEAALRAVAVQVDGQGLGNDLRHVDPLRGRVDSEALP